MYTVNLLSDLITTLSNTQTDIEEYMEFQKNSTLFDLDNPLETIDINKCIKEELTSLDYSSKIESQINKLDLYFNHIKTLYNLHIAQKNNYLSLKMDSSMVESSPESQMESPTEDMADKVLEEVSKMFEIKNADLNPDVYGSETLNKG